jgi:secreted PhoX family phosphatase
MGGHDEKDKYVIRSQDGVGDGFFEVIERRLSRRDFLKTVTIASSVMIAGGEFAAAGAVEAATNPGPIFSKVAPTAIEYDDVVVAEGYFARTLLRWGDPIMADAPEFDVWNQTPEAQAKQFGYNCDFVGFLPLPFGSRNSSRGLLVVNHEYTNEDLMFPNYSAKSPSKTQVDIALQAHGLSVVEIALTGAGWEVVRDSKYNRRLTATTPMTIAGPAAGHDWLKTSADPSGTTILGTLNNCAAGKTPWGTVVTAEENFHQYFAHLKYLDRADPRVAAHTRYGLTSEASERGWELYYSRFDVSRAKRELPSWLVF